MEWNGMEWNGMKCWVINNPIKCFINDLVVILCMHDIPEVTIISVIDTSLQEITDKYVFENNECVTDLRNILLNEFKKHIMQPKNKYINFLKSEYSSIKQNSQSKISFSDSQKILKDIGAKWTANKIKKPNNSIPKKLSGYNIFYKTNVISLMKTKPENIGIMKHVSISWKILSVEEKQKYSSMNITQSLL